jgi:hypothetical protein
LNKELDKQHRGGLAPAGRRPPLRDAASMPVPAAARPCPPQPPARHYARQLLLLLLLSPLVSSRCCCCCGRDSEKVKRQGGLDK